MILKKKFFYLFFLLTRRIDFLFFLKIRAYFFKKFLSKEIKNLVVRSDVYLFNYKKLTLGDDVSINHGCFLSCEGGLSIGNFVAIGHNTSIITTEHSYYKNDIPIKYQPIKLNPVIINDNIWIGANVTILSGVTLGSGIIVAAGSVVTKSFLENDVIIGGIPAKIIKRRFND